MLCNITPIAFQAASDTLSSARAVKVTLVMHITRLETGGQSRSNEQAD